MAKAKAPEKTVLKEDDKKTRRRSPNYPAVHLENAVERARALYDADGTAGCSREAALKHIGFSSPHGQALAVFSALYKFGLVEARANRVVPTQLAVDILEFPKGNPRHDRALREAVLGPSIYKELVEEYTEAGRLPSDDSLRPELIADRGFNPKVVTGFLADFRQSLEFAGLLDGNKLNLSKPKENAGFDEFFSDLDKLMPTGEHKTALQKEGHEQPSSNWTIPLVGGMAILRTPNPLTTQNLQLIEAWLKTMKIALVGKAE